MSRHGFALFAWFLGIAATAAAQGRPIQIGMAKSFTTDKAQSVVEIAADDFKKVLKTTTGLEGDVSTKFDAFDVADKLDKKALDFGIFHAHELAWVQKKHQDLVPLLVAANKQHEERAYLIVHKNNPAKSVVDLKGKNLDMPNGTNEPCRQFIGKLCQENSKQTPAQFFGAIEKTSTQTKALDGVAFESTHAVVVNTTWLEFYKEIKGPTFTKHLRILQVSENFPPAAIVYKKGAVPDALLKQFTTGLLKAHTTNAGRTMMKDWGIDAFEPIPGDYAARLSDLLKAYPPR